MDWAYLSTRYQSTDSARVPVLILEAPYFIVSINFQLINRWIDFWGNLQSGEKRSLPRLGITSTLTESVVNLLSSSLHRSGSELPHQLHRQLHRLIVNESTVDSTSSSSLRLKHEADLTATTIRLKQDFNPLHFNLLSIWKLKIKTAKWTSLV